MIRLFPYVLIRVAGGPFEDFAKLSLCESIRAFENIFHNRKRLEGVKAKLCDSLFKIIQIQKSPSDKVALINLKRDIFNGRELSSDSVNFLCHYFPPEIVSELAEYIRLRDAIPLWIQEGEAVFNQEVLLVRRHLATLARRPSLQKGLLLSSQALLRSINSYYLNRKGVSLSRKDHDTEEGLIKYLSRMYSKTSPFSTFTNLSMGRVESRSKKDLEDNDFILSLERDDPLLVTSHVRLNNFLFQYLRGLLIRYAAAYRCFLLRPNPTIQKRDDHYHFLTNSNNIEAFQRIPASPVIDVLHTLTKSNKEGIPYGELIQTFVEKEHIDASVDQIEAYVNRLIEYGFLEFNLGVSGIDPDWDINLRKKLQSIAEQVPLVLDLNTMLRRVREFAEKYGQSNVEERKHILDEAFNEFKAFCMKLHEAADLPAEERLPREEYVEFQKRKQQEKAQNEKEDVQEGEKENEETFRHQASTFFSFKPEQMFYEDTTLEISPSIDQIKINALVATLHDLLQCLHLFERHADERDKMRLYFMTKYGESADVDLLTFYEDYYRECKKPEAERIERNRKERLEKEMNEESAGAKGQINSPKDNKGGDAQELGDQHELTLKDNAKIKERMERRTKWLEEFTARIRDRVANKNGASINVKLEDVKVVTELTKNVEPKAKNCSYGVLAQLFEDTDQNGHESIKGVLNDLYPGFGKMMSRFLHIFDDAVTHELRTWNQQVSSEDLLIEDCDASYFNANLHPPLMPYEVWMPGGHNSVAPENQIPVMELHISLKSNQESVQLIHYPTGRPAHLFDLGFQGWGGRSQLFQLLDAFTLAEHLPYRPLNDSINRLAQSEHQTTDQSDRSPSPRILIQPRVLFEDRLIIQRKAWLIPREFLPVAEAKESEWRYFQRVNEWRLRLDIPEEVFVFCARRVGQEDIKPEEAGKLGRHDYKPQYINFRNPFLTSLFRKLVRKSTETLRIEEMLPNSEQLVTIRGKKYVTEFLIQWYSGGENAHE